MDSMDWTRACPHVGLVLTLACGWGCTVGLPDAKTDGDGSADGDDSGDSGTADETDESTGEEDDGVGEGEGDGTNVDPLDVMCGEFPAAAVGAMFTHEPIATGGAESYTWSASGLPPGLAINSVTGEIAGVPTSAGDFVIALHVESGADPVQDADVDCLLAVGPALSVDYDALEGPCIRPEDDVHDMLVGGDGTAVTCTVMTGSGNGVLPQGVTIDPESCATLGSITDARYGTWVWMVGVEQSGFSVAVPFCATQAEQEADAYTITVDHGGSTDNGLVPGTGTFSAGVDVAYGPEEGDPFFTITGGCGVGCSYGYLLRYGGSPFDDVTGAPAQLIMGGGGFTHNLAASGPPVEAKFEGRPWVLPVTFTYCLADMIETCEGSDNITANSNGNLQFHVIMMPE